MKKTDLKKITIPMAPNTCTLSGDPLEVKDEIGNGRVVFKDAYAKTNDDARAGRIYSGAHLDELAKEKTKAEKAAAKALLAGEEKAKEAAEKAVAKAEKAAVAKAEKAEKKDGK